MRVLRVYVKMYLFLVNFTSFFTSYANNCKKHTLFPSITDTTAAGSHRGACDLIPIYVLRLIGTW